jgi:citrate synthase
VTEGGDGKTRVRAGLEGVVIAESVISAVDGDEGRLSYRGIDIGDLARHSTFEETVYLLWWDKLPTREELDAFTVELAEERELDPSVRRLIASLPGRASPMDALRTAVSALACSDADDGDRSPEANMRDALSLTAKLPTIVAYHYRHLRGQSLVPPSPYLGHAANFLYMLHGRRPTEQEARAMDLAMLLMVDHGFNASTFAARVTASTLSDMVSAITTAIGTLKGSLHGGANRRAMEMLLEVGDADHAAAYIDETLAAGKRIMGFGHRVYKRSADPRAAYLRAMLYDLCAAADDFTFFHLTATIADIVEARKGLYPNVDFYTAPLLYTLDVPLELFTPIFAMSRVPGWTAQVMEQYAHNRLLRPLCSYVGHRDRAYVPLETR